VIRADNSEELMRAVNWVRAIQSRADRTPRTWASSSRLHSGAEYGPGRHLERGEGSLPSPCSISRSHGRALLRRALYIHRRGAGGAQDCIHEDVARACRVPGSRLGRSTPKCGSMTRVSGFLRSRARSIGGLCGRVLTHSLA